MREIKFRGITERNSNWVHGAYAKQGDIDMIMVDFHVSGDFNPANVSFDFYRVKPETVGQFTGLHDRNGVEIYEGDILEVNFNDDCCDIGKQKAIIKYSNKHASFLVNPIDNWAFCEMSDGKVIGNIHEEEQPCTSAIVE